MLDALAWLRELYGSIHGYLSDHGHSSAEQDALRERLTENCSRC
ncbi:MAG TPA: tyrosine-protein phosphatase [Chloroflexota bacterium]